MKFLAIDYGRKKMGIAYSDGLGSMAFPKYVLPYSSIEHVMQKIISLCIENQMNGIVVGIPLYKDGNMSPLAKEICFFISCLQEQFDAEYFVINEYLTSFEARTMAYYENKSHLIDAYSAKIILDSFLALTQEQRILHRFIREA